MSRYLKAAERSLAPHCCNQAALALSAVTAQQQRQEEQRSGGRGGRHRPRSTSRPQRSPAKGASGLGLGETQEGPLTPTAPLVQLQTDSDVGAGGGADEEKQPRLGKSSNYGSYPGIEHMQEHDDAASVEGDRKSSSPGLLGGAADGALRGAGTAQADLLAGGHESPGTDEESGEEQAEDEKASAAQKRAINGDEVRGQADERGFYEYKVSQ